MVGGSEGNEDFEGCGLARRGAVAVLVACLMVLAGAAAAGVALRLAGWIA